MDNYAVVCDCDGREKPHKIASIFDDRPNGGRVMILPAGDHTMSYRDTPTNRRGDHVTAYRLYCEGRCGREIRAITEATAGDIIDKMAPVRNQLEVVQIALRDEQAPRWLDELIEFVGGRNRFAIPFAMFCKINSKIGEGR